jgi:uncharacterized membrane protein
MDWESYVHLAFDEIRLAGASSPQVTRRITTAIADLFTVTPPHRRAVLEEELALLRRDVDRSDTGAENIDMALVPDRQGIGVSAGRSNGR